MNRFKPIFIEGTTLGDVWYQLLWAIYESGREFVKTSGSRIGMKTYALDFVSGFIHYPHIRPLSPIMPEGSKIPSPTTDEKINEYFINYLMDNKLSRNEHYRYSTWIKGDNVEKSYEQNHNICEIDQLDWLIKHFKTNGYGNNHGYIVIGNPSSCLEYDKPYMKCLNCNVIVSRSITNRCPTCHTELIIDETLRPTTPCLRGLDFRIIDNILTTNVIYRSWDIFAWPENMGGFTLLNEYVAQCLNIEPGPISFVSKSLQCPEDVLDILKMRLKK